MSFSPVELLFATHNLHKVKEVASMVGSNIVIKSLVDFNYTAEIPETADTFEDNALQKVHFVHQLFGGNCFADDSGLIVPALGNRPGVLSARYAGNNATYSDNVDKLLSELKDSENRNAYFITLIALIFNEKAYLFEGKIEGEIIKERRGIKGFGYDPVFIPNGYTHTFAEMTDVLKNSISHRGIALRKMIDFLPR